MSKNKQKIHTKFHNTEVTKEKEATCGPVSNNMP